jgi:hypothetical protein
LTAANLTRSDPALLDLLCRYNHSGVTALRFEADYSGLMHFTTAECVVEVEVVEDKIIEVGRVGLALAPSYKLLVTCRVLCVRATDVSCTACLCVST